jgi:hypothetical protein
MREWVWWGWVREMEGGGKKREEKRRAEKSREESEARWTSLVLACLQDAGATRRRRY